MTPEISERCGTIEPRLIALRNDDSFSVDFDVTFPSLELPPLHDPNILKASGRPLVLEPDASGRSDNLSSGSHLGAPYMGVVQQRPAIGDDDNTRWDADSGNKQSSTLDVGHRTSGNSYPQALWNILEDTPDDDLNRNFKWRIGVESGKDGFVQLPRPHKMAKALKQVAPPMIIQLLEPPPQTAIFPPIASTLFPESETLSGSGRVEREPQARRKWSKEETNKLLLGVSKYGVGRWTDILGDSDFTIDNRSGTDLKDRFRTCCPVEFQLPAAQPPTHSSEFPRTSNVSSQPEQPFSMRVEGVIQADLGADSEAPPDCSTSPTKSNPCQGRAHRFSLTELAELGIKNPFAKSQRRKRQRFTQEEDRALFTAYQRHGAAWSLIQRDPQYHLQARQPTDLRDRFRNLHPNLFGSKVRTYWAHDTRRRSARAKSAQEMPESTISDNRERLSISNISPGGLSATTPTEIPSFKLSSASNWSAKDMRPLLPRTTATGTCNRLTFPSYDWPASATVPRASSLGDMDISRLLLDETWEEDATSDPAGKPKSIYTNINSILCPSRESPSHGSSFHHILAADPVHVGGMPTCSTLDQNMTNN